MADRTPPGTTREQRLAAKLRENLHRRKAQSRALGAAADSADVPQDDPGDDPAGLSKPPPSR
ncbi:MAG: hypothetical protein KGM17_09880 [Sphingomonadales bacterium]|nr:hypothetical protein [Sphingomonadales bacterium]